MRELLVGDDVASKLELEVGDDAAMLALPQRSP